MLAVPYEAVAAFHTAPATPAVSRSLKPVMPVPLARAMFVPAVRVRAVVPQALSAAVCVISTRPATLMDMLEKLVGNAWLSEYPVLPIFQSPFPFNAPAVIPAAVSQPTGMLGRLVRFVVVVTVVIVPAVMFVGLATLEGNVTPAPAVTVWPANWTVDTSRLSEPTTKAS